MQTLEIKGQYVKVFIESQYTKQFSEAELILMTSQILKAYTDKTLKSTLKELF
jgi:hypothetical protein